MTQATYSEMIRSADELPFDLFRSRWLLMPECDSILGFDASNLDHSAEVLRTVYDEINLPIQSLRAASGLSQRRFADLFAIPFRTVQNWEARGGCPIYLRLLFRPHIGLTPISEILGVDLTAK